MKGGKDWEDSGVATLAGGRKDCYALKKGSRRASSDSGEKGHVASVRQRGFSLTIAGPRDNRRLRREQCVST